MGKARRLSHAIPYVGRNWVIGGSEPRSFAVAQKELTQSDRKRLRGQGKPVAITPNTPAQIADGSPCAYCGRTIKLGVSIVKGRFRKGEEQWVHKACSSGTAVSNQRERVQTNATTKPCTVCGQSNRTTAIREVVIYRVVQSTRSQSGKALAKDSGRRESMALCGKHWYEYQLGEPLLIDGEHAISGLNPAAR